jgi:phosphoesterase RecJ-like protein
MLDWSELESRISESERVLITTHVRPDGDALGSELAMADLLLQKGKEVEIYNPSSTPARYRFLDPQSTRIGSQVNGRGRPRSEPDLLMVLDTGTWSQLAGLADFVRQTRADKVVLDHHESQDDLGALALVDPRAEACGMLVHEAYRRFGGQIAPQTASALFVAIGMDTGWLHHSNTTAAVMRVLAELIEHGAEPHRLYQQLYEANSLARYRLLATMLQRLELLLDGRLAVSHLLQRDIAAAGAHPMDTEDFINFAMGMAGVETAVLLIEQAEGGVKISFRSRGGVDCRRLAEQFGGGGHRPAAGAFVNRHMEEARPIILGAVSAAMS